MQLAIQVPKVLVPPTTAAEALRTGDDVVVVAVAWIPATRALAGRTGKLLVLDRARTIAGVRLDGVMHAMPANCLRRVADELVLPTTNVSAARIDGRAA